MSDIVQILVLFGFFLIICGCTYASDLADLYRYLKRKRAERPTEYDLEERAYQRVMAESTEPRNEPAWTPLEREILGVDDTDILIRKIDREIKQEEWGQIYETEGPRGITITTQGERPYRLADVWSPPTESSADPDRRKARL